MTSVSLTVAEKILLHLSAYSKFRESWEFPWTVTQEGVAQTINIRQSQVSREMKKLISDDYVVERSGHVKGEAKRRKGYFLQPRGSEFVQKMLKEIEQRSWTVRDDDGNINKLRFSEIRELVGDEMPPLTVIRALSEGPLDLNELREGGGFKDYVDHSHQLPRIHRFFGRKNEAERLRSWNAGGKRVLILYGLPGMGKTTLVSRLTPSWRREANLFYHRVRKWDSLRAFLEHISQFLAAMRKDRTLRYLREKNEVGPETAANLLLDDLQNSNSILIFDNMENAVPPIGRLVSDMMDGLEKSDGWKLILVGRSQPKFHDNLDKVAEVIRLNGLNEKNAAELLRWRKFELEDEDLRKLWKVSEGNPQLLELLSSKGDWESAHGFIREEVCSTLSEEERRLMENASIYRRDVEKDILLDGMSIDSLCSLASNLLVDLEDGHAAVHGAFKEFFYREMPEELRGMHHAKAADYYLSQGEKGLGEALYHLVKAGDEAKAKDVILDHGLDMAYSGSLSEVRSVLKSIDSGSTPPEKIPLLSELKADIMELDGKYENAISAYSRLVETVDDNSAQSRLHRKIGNVLEKLSRFDEALEAYDKGLKVSGKGIEAGRIYLGKGSVLLRLGNHEGASENVRMAMQVFEKLGEERDNAHGYLARGSIESYIGRYAEAYSLFKKAISIFAEFDDKYGLSDVHTALGNLQYIAKNYDAALDHYAKSMEIREHLGDMRGISRAHSNIGNIYASLGDYEKAMKYYRKSIGICRSLNDKIGLAYNHCVMGEILLKALRERGGEREVHQEILEHCEDGLEISHSIGAKEVEGWARRLFGMLHGWMKEWHSAAINFERSVKLFKELNNKAELGKTYYEYSIVLNAQGSKEEARKYGRLAAEIFEAQKTQMLVNFAE